MAFLHMVDMSVLLICQTVLPSMSQVARLSRKHRRPMSTIIPTDQRLPYLGVPS